MTAHTTLLANGVLRRFYSAFPSPGSLLLSHLPQARLDLRLGLPAVEDSPAKVSKTEVLGSAILAAVGAGIYPNIQEAARHMVHTSHRIEPDQQRHKELEVTGSANSRRADYQTALQLIESGRIKVEPMVTDRFPLRFACEALEKVASGECIKVAVLP